MKPSEVLDIMIQAAGALARAHQAGIVHRDIKPENVMVRSDGLVKVLDFGLAKLTAASPSDSEAATRISDTLPGMIMGTVAYMSPEQARGKVVDARTDVWSLGVLLYEMLSGRPPFSGATAADILAAILSTEPPPLDTLAAAPGALNAIVAKAMRKDRIDRYSTADDLLMDL